MKWELVDHRYYMKDSVFMIPKWAEKDEIARHRNLERMGRGWLMVKRSTVPDHGGIMVKEELLWRSATT